MFNFSQKHLRRTGTALAVVFSLWGSAAGHALSDDRTYTFDIPSEDTAKALNDFSRQTGIQILFPYEQAAGHRAPALSGKLDVNDALSRLINGTGLEIAEQTATSIALRSTGGTPATTTSADNDSPSTEVVVTGSHIRGGNPTAPVHTLTQKDIEQSGYSQVGDLIRSLPENFSGGQNPGVIAALAGSSTNSNASNASTVNLRGLGSDATLVLVNGHRLPGDSSNQGADISGIPLAAIQRVEVVSDGASALYGSDAVAGVANFVLRRNFNGGEVSARLGGASQGGGGEHTYNGLLGAAKSGWFILGDLEYSKQDEIRAGQREFLTNASPIATLMEPQVRRSFFGSAGGKISDQIDFGVDALLSDRSASYTQQTTKTTYIGYNSTYIPGFSITPTVNVKLPGDWNLHLIGGASGSRDVNHATIPAYAYTNRTAYANNEQYGEITADGDLLNLPSGPVKTAFGAGYRREAYKTGLPTSVSYVNTSRTVQYAYGEAYVPLVAPSSSRNGLNELEVDVAARAEHYSDFGSSTNPRLGVRYVPLQGLTVRGSWGTSFKAPSFNQMYFYPALYLYPATSLGYTGGKAGATVILDTGGNKALKPEKSRSWTAGFDFTPASMKSLKVSATYFSIDYKDRVVQPVSNLVGALRTAIYVPFVETSPSSADLTTLVASIPNFTNYAGAAYDPTKVVAVVMNQWQNATAQTANGVDLSYRQTFHVAGSYVDTFADGTWLQLKQQTLSTQPLSEYSGLIFHAPKFKARGGASWREDGFEATAIINYLDHETDNVSSPSVEVGSWTTLDANLAYHFGQTAGLASGVSVVLAASNLLDRNPPYAFASTKAYAGLNFDSTNTSVVGRFVSLTVKKSW